MAELDPGVWDDLCDILNDRFSKDVPTTEDSVRYCFFHILVCSRKICKPNEVVLEYQPRVIPKTKTNTLIFKYVSKHLADVVPRTQIDTVILRGKGDPDCAIEFKFHRKPENTEHSPLTMNAGELFYDFFKQAKFKKTCSNVTCYVAYVTDEEMHRYFSNPNNMCKTWYDLEPGERISLDEEYFSRAKPTFRKYSKSVVPCKATRVAKRQVNSEHALIVDEVDPYLDASR